MTTASISFEDTTYADTAESLLKSHALGQVITSAIGNSRVKTTATIDADSIDTVTSAVDAVNAHIDEHSPTLEVRFF